MLINLFCCQDTEVVTLTVGINVYINLQAS